MYTQLIRWLFERFYREFSWSYDSVAALVSAGQWRSWALSVQPWLRGRVLELGCGTGYLQLALAQQPSPAIGIDRSSQMISHTRRRLARYHLLPRLAQADTTALPFQNASFDTLVATFPTDYLIHPTTLAEAHRVLAPGGQIVSVLGARLISRERYQQLVDLAYRLTLQRTADTATTPLLINPWQERISAAGFQPQFSWKAVPGGEIFLLIAKRDP